MITELDARARGRQAYLIEIIAEITLQVVQRGFLVDRGNRHHHILHARFLMRLDRVVPPNQILVHIVAQEMREVRASGPHTQVVAHLLELGRVYAVDLAIVAITGGLQIHVPHLRYDLQYLLDTQVVDIVPQGIQLKADVLLSGLARGFRYRAVRRALSSARR